MKVSTYSLLHIIFVASLTIFGCTQKASWEELNAKSEELYRQGRYLEGITVAEEALSVAEKTFRPDHPNVAISLNILAELYRVQGKYNEAEPIHER